MLQNKRKIVIPGKFQNVKFIKYHYVLLAVLINIPGNTIIGGGGGIACLCGINEKFSWKSFVLTVAIAVSPVPLLIYFGFLQIETLIG